MVKIIYDIFYQQQVCNLNLQGKDILILGGFIELLPSMQSIKENGNKYYQMDYQKIIDYLPIAKIKNKDVMARKFNKFVEIGLLTKKITKNRGGTKVYFSFNIPKFKNLIVDNCINNLGV